MDDRLKIPAAAANVLPEQLGLQVLADKAFQEQILPGVSRAFACAVPALPDSLRAGMANIYLLNRSVQIIAERLGLDPAARQAAFDTLLAAVEADVPVQALAAELSARPGADLAPADRELIRNLPRILRVSRSLPLAQRQPVQRCLRSLCETHQRFDALRRPDGLPSLQLFEEFCAGTAGAVAEATTSLLCRYSPAIARNSGELMALAASFGQGVQMTHMLKGLWEDRRRGVCWLPRDLFLHHGCQLDPRSDWSKDPAFHAGMAELISHICGHLHDGLAYTLLIPTREDGIRRFCAWPIGMALAILKRLQRHPSFTSSDEVKVTQSAVRAVVTASRFAVSRDWLLKGGFALAVHGLIDERPPASCRSYP